MADIEQGQQMIPLTTREISFDQNVCELVFGVDVFDLDFGVQIDSIEQPIKSNSVELRLCVTVGSFYSPVRNIFPRISLHYLPCLRTMKKCSRQVSLNKAAFLQRQQRSWIPTYFCDCLQYLCLSDILKGCNPNFRGQGMMLAFTKSTSFMSIFHSGSRFCFLPAMLISSTYTDKNNPLSLLTNELNFNFLLNIRPLLKCHNDQTKQRPDRLFGP